MIKCTNTRAYLNTVSMFDFGLAVCCPPTINGKRQEKQLRKKKDQKHEEDS